LSPKQTSILTLYTANSVNEGFWRQNIFIKTGQMSIIRSHTDMKLQVLMKNVAFNVSKKKVQ